jgi:hypothetical protein
MADLPGPTAGGALRASDADRERVTRLLGEHSADGRLTLDELAERVDAALQARTQAELDALLTDLPATPAPATTPARRVSERTVAVMSGAEKTGRWRADGKHTAVAVMGGIELDLRQAEIVGDELEILAVAVMGGIEIIVPEGISVDVSSLPLMGGIETKLPDVPPLPGAPVLRVRAIAFMGGIEIKAKPHRRWAGLGRVVEPPDPVPPPLPPPAPEPPPVPPTPPQPPSLPR